MKLTALLSFIFLSTLCFANTEQISAEHVKIKLLIANDLKKNSTTKLGIQFDLDPHWHVYWKNPGDSGADPKFSFNLNGAKLNRTHWPRPKRIPVEHLVNIGYENQVVYVFDLDIGNSDEVRGIIDLEWLVCKVDCIPGFATLSFSRPTSYKSDFLSKDLQLIDKFYQSSPSNKAPPYSVKDIKINNKHIDIYFNGKIEAPDAFPYSSSLVNNQEPSWNKDEKKLSFTINDSKQSELNLVIYDQGQGYDLVDILKNSNSFQGDKSTDSIFVIIFFAFIGGLILNLMPCVLPVISIKVFSLLKAEKVERQKECLLYSFGVISSIIFLGSILVLLKKLGHSIGWGFHLQYPLFVYFLIFLFWIMAFMFLGFIEIKVFFNFEKNKFNSNSLNSFFTGVLSVLIATPCTGPLMGVALGATLTLDSFQSLLVFLFLGLGLAFPFLIFCISKRSLKWLPEPGPWMEKLKQFFAFPLFATCLWLIWVLQQQKGDHIWLIILSYLTLFSFLIWTRSVFLKGKFLILILILLTILSGAIHLNNKPSNIITQQSNWNSFSEKKLNEIKKNQTVFIDYTAAWCITCQVNKHRVLDTSKTQQFFAEKKVYLMRADWTDYNKEITQSLEKLGRNSVPVYVIYKPNLETPIILPQILKFNDIESNL